MKIFLVGSSFYKSYGGPAFSVSGLGLALAEAGFEVGLWAPDGSALSSNVIPDVYSTGLKRLAGSLHQTLREFGLPDIIHDNGMWLCHNHRIAVLAKREAIPRVVSIRGMLEPWAINHKRMKKRLAWWLYQRDDLKSASMLHVTALMENDHLEKYRLGVPVETIPNGVEMPSVKKIDGEIVEHSLKGDIRVALFMSRLHPVKGLPMLIEAWSRVKPTGWRLVIAGPDEGGHQIEIERLVADRGLVQDVSFLGEIEPENRHWLYQCADLFVLPTHSENFGMVIGEALAHGAPVLTTKGAPWPMLEEKGCGWWVDPSVEGLVDGLRAATSCTQRELKDKGKLGRKFVSRHYSWESIAGRFCDVYLRLMETHQK